MPGVFLFDLDMTLVDSSALAQMRRFHMWENVRQNMHLIRPFPAQGRVAPHELPRSPQSGWTDDWYRYLIA